MDLIAVKLAKTFLYILLPLYLLFISIPANSSSYSYDDAQKIPDPEVELISIADAVLFNSAYSEAMLDPLRNINHKLELILESK